MPWRHQLAMIASDFFAWPIVTVERPFRNRAIELRAIGHELRLQVVEHLLGKSVWIGGRLEHQRRHRADQRRLRHAALAMPSQIVSDFTATGGMADVNRILQVEMIGDGLQIVGIMVEVVTIAYLRRTAVAASVVGDDPITLGEEEQHLRVPIVRTERPAMAEHDGLSFAPVFVINSYSVFGFDVAHNFFSLVNASFIFAAF